MEKLAKEIITGKRLKRNDNLEFLLTVNLKELCAGANIIREKLCAQSAHNNTSIEAYAFLDPDVILEDCKKNEATGIHRYSIVTAGRSLTGPDFNKAIEAYKKMHEECKINLCASHGFLTQGEFIRLKEAGVTMYHENIETSKKNFHNICTTHSYEDKIKEIKLAQKSGLNVCSGGIIGMGESWKDRIDMAISLSELGIISIPINVLMPIKGTPFGTLERISDEDILRTIAIFRYLNPTAYIRMAAGRTYFADGGSKIFLSGANATLSYIVYLFIGLIGLPVFSGFSGGFTKLFGPTGGYLIGFIFMAFISGIFIEKFSNKIYMCFLGMILGTIVAYIIGTAWLAYQANLTFNATLAIGVLPFIPGDIVKMIIASLIGPKIKKRLISAGLY